MLKPRIITSLLLDTNQNLVKTVNFDNRQYIGDPLNAAYIFSNFKVDELLILDIDASNEKRCIPYDFVDSLSSFTSVPLTIGGGISKIDEIKELLSLGAEKIAISSILNENIRFLEVASKKFGSSTISALVNIAKDDENNYIGAFGRIKKNSKFFLLEEILEIIRNSGAGELIINNVDRDGVRSGFDIELIKKINNNLSIPVVALGGCGNRNHIVDLLKDVSVSGVACASFFVYAQETNEVLLKYESLSDILNQEH